MIKDDIDRVVASREIEILQNGRSTKYRSQFLDLPKWIEDGATWLLASDGFELQQRGVGLLFQWSV